MPVVAKFKSPAVTASNGRPVANAPLVFDDDSGNEPDAFDDEVDAVVGTSVIVARRVVTVPPPPPPPPAVEERTHHIVGVIPTKPPRLPVVMRAVTPSASSPKAIITGASPMVGSQFIMRDLNREAMSPPTGLAQRMEAELVSPAEFTVPDPPVRVTAASTAHMHDEIARLGEEIVSLRQERDDQRDENARLRDEMASLRDEMASLRVKYSPLPAERPASSDALRPSQVARDAAEHGSSPTDANAKVKEPSLRRAAGSNTVKHLSTIEEDASELEASAPLGATPVVVASSPSIISSKPTATPAAKPTAIPAAEPTATLAAAASSPNTMPTEPKRSPPAATAGASLALSIPATPPPTQLGDGVAGLSHRQYPGVTAIVSTPPRQALGGGVAGLSHRQYPGVTSVVPGADAPNDAPKEGMPALQVSMASKGTAAADPDVLSELSQLDRQEKGLIEALEKGYIRLLRSAWLLAQPPSYRIENRQKLEERESNGESPLLTPAKAVELVRSANRSAGALTHGWLSPANVRSVTSTHAAHPIDSLPHACGPSRPFERPPRSTDWPRSHGLILCTQPDPAGARLAVLRRALANLDYIIGIFFDFSSLYQMPRTPEQDEIFKKALPACDLQLSSPHSTHTVPTQSPYSTHTEPTFASLNAFPFVNPHRTAHLACDGSVACPG